MDNHNKHLVQVFPPISSSGCNCNCNCSSQDGSPEVSLEEMLSSFHGNHGEMAKIKVYSYEMEMDAAEAAGALTEILAASNQRLQVDMTNLEMVLSQSAPIFAIDGKIACAGTVPTEKQLFKAVTEGVSIPQKAGCC